MNKKANIRILDEVHLAITGLQGVHTEYFYKKYSLFATNYFFNPKFKLGRWDGTISHFSKSGKTFLYLLPEILPDLIKFGYELKLDDLRQATPVQIPPVTEDIFAHCLHPDSGKPIILRDYQVNAINNVLEDGNGIILASTGAGKTLIAAGLLQAYTPHCPKTITIVPDQNLIMQTTKTFEACQLDVGEYSGKRKTLDHQHIVSTWQALQHNPMLINGFDLVLVDECLDENTQILMSDYSTKNIKDVRAGDLVISFNTQTNQYESDVIIKQYENLAISSNEQMYRLEFDNGYTLEVTGNHKIYTNKGIVRADELTEDHEIIFVHGNP